MHVPIEQTGNELRVDGYGSSSGMSSIAVLFTTPVDDEAINGLRLPNWLGRSWLRF